MELIVAQLDLLPAETEDVAPDYCPTTSIPTDTIAITLADPNS